MKMPPQYQKAQENMKPGVITSDGFLGNDTRPLVDIIEADEERMKALELDFDAVADTLQHLLEEGRKGLGEPVTVDGNWVVRTDEARGFLASPFEDGIFRKVNAEVERLEEGPAGQPVPTGARIIYTSLSLHLLRKYHFLQGHGASFRLEPEAIRSVLYG